MSVNGSSLVSKGSSLGSSLVSKGFKEVSSSFSTGSNTSVKKAEKESIHLPRIITSREFINRFPYESSTPINESIPIWEEIKTPK